MKSLNKKGFTLIELLAVIIILGVLMIIAIPSVTTYIQNSRKSAYVDTAAAYIEAVRTRVNEGKDFQLFATDTLYLIPVGDKLNTGDGSSCVSVESGGQSPFSDKWDFAYVGVQYDGKGYSYYFVGQDGAKQGLGFMTFKELQDEGVNHIYSSTSDAEFSSTVPATLGTGVVIKKQAADEQLITGLIAAYADKLNHTVGECDDPTQTGCTAYALSNHTLLTDVANSQDSVHTVSKLVILGTCHS